MNESFKYEEKNIIKDKDLPPDLLSPGNYLGKDYPY